MFGYKNNDFSIWNGFQRLMSFPRETTAGSCGWDDVISNCRWCFQETIRFKNIRLTATWNEDMIIKELYFYTDSLAFITFYIYLLNLLKFDLCKQTLRKWMNAEVGFKSELAVDLTSRCPSRLFLLINGSCWPVIHLRNPHWVWWRSSFLLVCVLVNVVSGCHSDFALRMQAAPSSRQHSFVWMRSCGPSRPRPWRLI